MIEIVEYKECTCDMCGVKESFPKSFDMPNGWGWLRLAQQGKELVGYHLCPDCVESVASTIGCMKG